MQTEDPDVNMKILVIGNGGVGKSTFINRFCKGTFIEQYKKTIGANFNERMFQLEDTEFKLMLWDIAGQRDFDSVTKDYYAGADAVILMFASADKGSFESIELWKSKIETECPNVPMVLVENKVDLIHKSGWDPKDTEDKARNLKLKLYRVSVKENLSVKEVVEYLLNLYVKKPKAVIEVKDHAYVVKENLFNGKEETQVKGVQRNKLDACVIS